MALVAMSFVDAIVRVCLGITIIELPAIAELPMTSVALFGVVGATAAFLGGIAILSWAVAHHRRRREHSIAYEALFDPIPVIALVCIVVGARLIIDPPAAAEQLRPLVAAGPPGWPSASQSRAWEVCWNGSASVLRLRGNELPIRSVRLRLCEAPQTNRSLRVRAVRLSWIVSEKALWLAHLSA